MSRLSLSKFNEEVNIAIPYLKAKNAEVFKLDANFVQELTDYLGEWQTLWAKTQDKTTRTSTLVEARNILRGKFEKAYHDMQRAVKYSSRRSTFSNEDLDKLFIHRDKKPHRIPVPTVAPALSIVNLRQGEIDLKISDPELPDLNHRALPADIDRTHLLIAIVPVGAAAPVDAAFHLFQTATKATAMLQFGEADFRKVVYIKAEFVNTKGEVGPRSEAINAVIPG